MHDIPQPPNPTVTEVDLAEFVSRLLQPDLEWAVSRVASLRSTGTTISRVLSDLLVPAQEEVGRRWQIGTATMGDEHAATAVVDAALAVAVSSYYTAPVRRSGVSVILVCAEGEWHSLPARMASEALRSAGVDVTFLGASLPVRSLYQFVAGRRPTALLVSTTLATNLLGASRCVAAGHRAGLPVLVGGAAFGGDSRRAEAIGADGYASNSFEALPLLRRWERQQPTLRPSTEPDRECLLVEMKGAELAEQALERLLARLPEQRQMTTAQSDHTRTDFGHILRFASAAHLCGDPLLFSDFTSWVVELLASRGVSPDTVKASYRVLAEVTREDLPAISELLAEGEIQTIRPTGIERTTVS